MKNTVIAIVVLALVVWGIYYFTSKKEAPTTENTPTVVEKTKTLSARQPSLRVAQNGVTIISYGAKGFSPFITEITVGETVRFVNNRSDKALRVVSTQPENSDLFYPGFSAAKSIAKGESFELPFTKAGAWSFTNLNDDNHQGVIIVTE